MTKDQARRYTFEQLQNMRAFTLELALDNSNPGRRTRQLRKAEMLLEVMDEKHDALVKAQSLVKPSVIRDMTGDIISFENGEMDWDEVVALFQKLVDTGLAWTLQGSYGRHAQWLIEQGVITNDTELQMIIDLDRQWHNHKLNAHKTYVIAAIYRSDSAGPGATGGRVWGPWRWTGDLYGVVTAPLQFDALKAFLDSRPDLAKKAAERWSFDKEVVFMSGQRIWAVIPIDSLPHINDRIRQIETSTFSVRDDIRYMGLY